MQNGSDFCKISVMKYKMSTQKLNHSLFHHVLKSLKAKNINGKKLLIAVSGGVDSICLLYLLLELKNILNTELSVVHVHHGSQSKKQKKFQDQALSMVKQCCEKNKIIFYSKILNIGVKYSEENMRQRRYDFFSECMKTSFSDYLVLAHTANDLLETRLIRLIRGTGRQGLTSMILKKDKLLRPFINVTRQQVLDYATEKQLSWCEDPSNQSSEYSFRNWIRNNWLMNLEQKRPGALKTLAKSIELIVENSAEAQSRVEYLYSLVVINGAVNRKSLQALSNKDKKEVLACYMCKQQFKNYSVFHIEELIKQLDRSQKKFTFSLLGKIWEVTPLWLTPQKKERHSLKK